MKLPKRLGMILLGIWLIATGLLQVLDTSFPGSVIILGIIAIAAGVLIMFSRAN